MNKEIIISIITPACNAAESLPRLYESIRQQIFSQFEWIIINDGSTDNTREVLTQLLKECPFEYQIFDQDNLGVSSARNKGLSASRGKYVFFADADDYLTPETLQALYDGIISGFDFCFGNYISQRKDGKVIRQWNFPYQSYKFKTIRKLLMKICRHKAVMLITIGLFKKSIIDQYFLSFNTSLTHTEDDLFLYQYLCCCRNALHINRNLYCYVLGDKNSTNIISRKRMLGTAMALKILIETMEERNIPERYRKAIENTIFREKFSLLFYLYFKEYRSLDFMDYPEIKILEKRLTRNFFNSFKSLKELIKLKGFFLIYNRILN